MMASPARAAAILLILAALSFVGTQVARSAVQGVAAPLAGIERLARPRSAPIPEEAPLFSREQFEESRVTRALEECVEVDPGPEDEPEQESVPIREGGRTRDFWIPLALESLKLSPLQRHQIERLLAVLTEAQQPPFIDIDQLANIGEVTRALVRAQLDYFQAQEFDRQWPADGVASEVGPGFVTRESARLEEYDLRAQAFQTLLRMDPMNWTYRPAVEAADELEADLLDCLPFRGR